MTAKKVRKNMIVTVPYGTYQRLNAHVSDSDYEVIRKARGRLRPEILRGRVNRKWRHGFYRAILKFHKAARDLYKQMRF